MEEKYIIGVDGMIDIYTEITENQQWPINAEQYHMDNHWNRNDEREADLSQYSRWADYLETL